MLRKRIWIGVLWVWIGCSSVGLAASKAPVRTRTSTKIFQKIIPPISLKSLTSATGLFVDGKLEEIYLEVDLKSDLDLLALLYMMESGLHQFLADAANSLDGKLTSPSASSRGLAVLVSKKGSVSQPPMIVNEWSAKDLSSEGLKYMLDFFHKHPEISIRSLILDRNQIGDSWVKEFACYLRGNKQLRELSLAYNNIGDAGAIALANAIFKNSNLQELNLSYNRIGYSGGQSLCKLLSQEGLIKNFVFFANPFVESSVGAHLDELRSIRPELGIYYDDGMNWSDSERERKGTCSQCESLDTEARESLVLEDPWAEY